MPGYGAKMEFLAPEPTEKTPELKDRFVMSALPKLSLVQMTILAMVLYYAWSVRKMNRGVISTVMVAAALLHVYDHLYRVKRGNEELFFMPGSKKEAYCTSCQK